MPVYTLTFECVADRGVALARLDGRALFVPLAAPGDVAEVEVSGGSKGFATGKLIRLIEPSPLRVEPPCPLFGVCGGCAWQHLAHPAQVEGKARSLAGFFTSRLKLQPELFRPAVPSPAPYGYRNRITLNLAWEGGKIVPSMTGRRSSVAVPVRNCPVAAGEVNRALEGLWEDGGLLKLLGGGARVLLQADSAGEVHLVAFTAGGLGGALARALASFAASASLASAHHAREGSAPLRVAGEGEGIPCAVTFAGRELPYRVPAGGFTQANFAMNQALADKVAGWRAHYEGRAAWDLFCGSGNFTLGLATLASSVIGVEGERAAARAARANAEALGFGNVRVHAAPVDGPTLSALPPADFWLLDPPRAGAPEAAGFAGVARPKAIGYVSCDPATMLRDLATLLSHGYRVEEVTAVDMFPQTAHLEVAALLTLL